MPVNIPTSGGTIAAVEGETYILSPNTTGSITFTGDVSFDVVIDTDQTISFGNSRAINFGAGTDPTVTYAAGVDASSHRIQSDGDSLTVIVGDGATIGRIVADDVSGPDGFVLDLGDNVTVDGRIYGPDQSGAPSDYTIGSGVTINGNLSGALRADSTMTIGDNLTLNGDLGETAFGFGSSTGNQTVTIGDNASIDGSVNFRSAQSSSFKAGDNLSIGLSFEGSNGEDTVIFGDNWFVDGSVDANFGNDQLALGYQGTDDWTYVFGGSGSDGMRLKAPPGDVDNFVDAAVARGWVDNGYGTVSSTTGSRAFSYNNHRYGAVEVPSTIPCFTTGTQIEVANGQTVNVEDLCQGDLVMTADRGLQPIRWIGMRTLGPATLAEKENMRPIRIARGALGGGMPTQDLVVSPQHRMLVRSKIVQRMFGDAEILVAAKHLLELDGIDIAHDVCAVTYVHFLCDTHEVVFANGAATESLYTGPQALKAVSQEALAEIMAIFPELADIDYKALSARQLVDGRKGRKLAERHINSGKPLYNLAA